VGTGSAGLAGLIAVPLAFTDIAVHRLPDPLSVAAFTGTLALLSAAALTSHQPGHLARAAIGAAALAFFYLTLCLIRPGDLGLGDAKLAAVTGLALGWTGWQALFAWFALAAVYGGMLLAAPGKPHESPAARAFHPPRHAHGHRFLTCRASLKPALSQRWLPCAALVQIR
jgi:prepilin signal peptidase PulO-like enzyme (type II secretory pathway)